jgi:hypothetical protein
MAPSSSKPGTSAPTAPLAAVSLGFTGATECDGPGGCWIPPDVAGAIGKAQFVSVSNNVFEVRSRAGLLLKTNSLNGLCAGYSAQSMFDPRVQWDEAWQRWVITAVAFPESSTVQQFCMAISQTSSATGKFWVYLVNVNGFGGAGSFYDFPMLGLADNAVLFTANVFLPNNGFQGSSLFGIEKSRLYNGLGFSVPVYLGLNATLQPAHQVFTDQNPCAWLAANSGGISMYKLCNPGTFSASLSGPIGVSGVVAYSVPPAAPQPSACAGTATLDSSDTRFVNAGTQNGDTYYQVHTIALGSFPAPKYYKITGLSSNAPTVSVSNYVFATSTSYDFNASIASDSNGNFGINWSYTDPPVGTLPAIRFADNNGGNPANSSGINVFTSASCYNTGTPQRWGDYSQTTADPGSGTLASGSTKVFWIDNETVPSANFWSTRVSKMKY